MIDRQAMHDAASHVSAAQRWWCAHACMVKQLKMTRELHDWLKTKRQAAAAAAAMCGKIRIE